MFPGLSSGHAWVAFALEHGPQVREAATRAQAAAAVRDDDDSDADDSIPVLGAYSDGSVLAKGVEGSAAALVRVFGTDVSATVRLASVDVALRRNDRDMAMLAWALDRERRERGYGELTALLQLGHAEKRKSRLEFDVHERYNGIVDGLTHETNDRMPVYASFLRDHTPHTTLWHEPLEGENVGGGAVHEVTCDSYKHITRVSQRRLSILRLRERDGPILATFSRVAIGRAKSDRVSPLTTNIMHGNLPTGARLELWAGAESGGAICACLELPKWSSRAEVGRLQ